jgi:hypothetical protein
MNGFRESRHFAFGRFEVAEPQLRIARETDPDRFVRGPFREWRRGDVWHGGRLTARPVNAKPPTSDADL